MTSVALKRAYHGVLRLMPAKISLGVQHFKSTRRWPNLTAPRTFNEKVLHRKLFEDNPEFVRLADKVAVKAYVEERIGARFVIPTLWSGTRLPDDAASRFDGPIVVKSNHTSGKNLFIDDPVRADWGAIGAEAAAWMAAPWQPHMHERWYNRMPRMVLIEPRVGPAGVALTDYKFFVFNGVPRLVQVDQGRFSAHRRALYGPDWTKLPVTLQYPPVTETLPRPRHFDAMLEAASALARGFSFVRVDFYDLDDGPRFGELTFAPGGGCEKFTPADFDAELGSYWTGTTTG